MHSHALLHDFRVNVSHTVDGVRSEHAQMGHVDALRLTLLNEGHPPQSVHIARELRRDRLTDAAHKYFKRCVWTLKSPVARGVRDWTQKRVQSYVQVSLVDVVDDQKMPRQQLLEHEHRPTFQRLW